ncbi:MAG: putative lipoprotein [Acidimicrobiales bacterium]|nr:putative lipoprotein [Acidimicrobiales bacterium]
MTDLMDEDRLRHLLSEAADAAPAPGRAAEDLLASLTDGDAVAEHPVVAPLRRRVTPRFVGVAAAVVLVVALIGVTLASGNDHPVRTASTGLASPPTTIPATGGAGAGGTTGGSIGGSTGAASADSPQLSESLGTDAKAAAPQLPIAVADAGSSIPAAAAPLTDSAKVVKTGSLDLQVRRGGFGVTVDSITTKAVGLGGYVADSTTTASGDSPSGTVTVRVPSTSFDKLLVELRKLGKVESVTQKGTEVSAQYTDLQARLSAQTATRDRLNVVLSKATTVPDILSVQDRITQVQTEIEQLQGQLRLLDDQTSMGTLAVSVAEPGAKLPVLTNPSDRTVRSAFREARNRFGNGVEAVIAWSGGALAVLLVGLIALVIARLFWTRFRRYLL